MKLHIREHSNFVSNDDHVSSSNAGWIALTAMMSLGNNLVSTYQMIKSWPVAQKHLHWVRIDL